MSGLRIIASHTWRNPGTYAAGFGMVAASSLLTTWIPRLLGQVTDILRQGRPRLADIGAFAVAILLIGALRVFTGWAGRVLVHLKGRELAYRLRRELFDKWCTLSPSYYHRKSAGDLISHALSDVDIVGDMVTLGFNQGIHGLALLFGALYLMVVHSGWQLTLGAVSPLLLIPVLVKWLGPAIRRQSQRAQEALGAMSQMVSETVEGIHVVKAFGNEEVFNKRFERRVDAINREKWQFARLSALFASLVPLMVNLGFIITLGYGGVLVAKGSISLGDFVSMTFYVALLRMPLEQLGNVVNIFQRAIPSLQRIDGLLRVVPEVTDRQRVARARPLQGALSVKGLTFRYPGSECEILRDISFTVIPGRTLGIIGVMGSGKTTLADLLLRLYDPPAGSMSIDGQDILDYSLAQLRSGIAYVPQEGFLFSGTVLENIGFADESPDRERVEQCASIAAIHETILGFPDGYETEIGDCGVRLSGGQKQRIAIARMIYKDAPIQIMDDSLSAVDAHTEREILENLRNLSRTALRPETVERKITVIISHRLSAVRDADEILVLDAGEIVERGSHATLLAMGGIYARQWFLQNDQFADFEPGAPGVDGEAVLHRPEQDVTAESPDVCHTEDLL